MSNPPPEDQQVPPTRANVAPEDAANRTRPPRKWIKDDAVWMRNSETELFEFNMFVDSWRYNEERGGWDYKLRNEAGQEWENWVKETDTKIA
ncbi:MAG: hypothetical protein HETSPECPRED_002541 [Heterodermia speciosa]|uniref:Uncharacterized protein n=1 Tax=Heterodermia speciosa TaxID=116794 RepID=A0A8H3F4P9_9LECA|nr:MAG: hypothetical protein HETSPECPRED_002541 [Heterodermia speciosa]